MENFFKRLRGGSSVFHVRENINDVPKALEILNKISQPTRDSYLAKQDLIVLLETENEETDPIIDVPIEGGLDGDGEVVS